MVVESCDIYSSFHFRSYYHSQSARHVAHANYKLHNNYIITLLHYYTCVKLKLNSHCVHEFDLFMYCHRLMTFLQNHKE